MMKQLKIAFLSLVIVLTAFTSCSDNESVEQEQAFTPSTSMKTAMTELGTRLDANGNIDASRNPSGNMVFDFGFSFHYPITLFYNNGSSVTVNSLDELLEVVSGQSEQLFIDGVEFPISVDIYNDETGAIETITINSEDALADLLDDIDFDNQDACDCDPEVVEPVCVQVEDAEGYEFVVTFPNACYAMCEGFEQEDFLENCNDDYNENADLDCFSFNFPLDIMVDDEVITVDSYEDLFNATYDAYYFDFVFPLSVTNEDGENVVIENELDLFEILDECFDDIIDDDNDDSDDDDDCDCPDDYAPVCVDTGFDIIPFQNMCYAMCEGFTQEDIVDCGDIDDNDDNDDNDDSDDNDDMTDCTMEDFVAALTACPWESFGNQNQMTAYDFSDDGTVVILTNDGTTLTTTWEITIPNSDNEDAFVTFGNPADSVSGTWYFTGCDDDSEVYTMDNTFIDRVCD